MFSQLAYAWIGWGTSMKQFIFAAVVALFSSRCVYADETPLHAITDNEANRYYSGRSGGLVESVVVTGSRVPETVITPGRIPVSAQVTVLYAAN